MALKLNSADLYTTLSTRDLDASTTRAAYNALDSAITLRVFDSLSEVVRQQNTPHAAISYRFVRAMQGPAMSMVRRGIAVNTKVRQDETERFLAIRAKAQALLDTLANAVWGPEHYTVVTKTVEWFTPIGKRSQPLTPQTRTVRVESDAQRPRGLNPNSDKQVLAFFNIALHFPVEYEIRKTPQGSVRTPSANGKALRKWGQARTKGPGVDARDRTIPAVRLAAPFVSLILTIRDADKMLSVLRTPLDPDGRMRCSYNVVGTENGRWSSSKSAFGRGTNLQNITPSMRRMFCADDGQWLISPDLEQAESRLVAGLVWQTTGDDTYWAACASGDLHTTVARMTWPELGWTDDQAANRKIANTPSRELPKFTYRDISKRLGHGSNYRGTPFGIAQAVGVPPNIVEDFQVRYFKAFPALPQWHAWCKRQLLDHQYLDTPLGRRRWFFGRPNEDATLREAIAFGPQSTVGELLNLIMYKVWSRSLLPQSDPAFLPLQLLLQNHDAFAFQVPLTTHLPTIINAVNGEFNSTPITFVRGGERRDLIIPGEFVTGFNWAYADTNPDPGKWTFSDGNKDGLIKWGGSDERIRTSPAVARSADFLGRPSAPSWR